MKQTILLICISIFCIKEIEAKKIKVLGTYVNNNLDTIDCEFNVSLEKTKNGDFKINFLSIQKKINVVSKPDNKKVKLKPKEIKEFEFGYNYSHYVFRAIDISKNQIGRKRFLKNSIDGQLKLYTQYKEILIPITSSNMNNGVVVGGGITLVLKYNRYFIQKGETEAYKITRKFYKTKFKDLIFDCFNVANSYNHEVLKIEELDDIILDYNSCRKP